MRESDSGQAKCLVLKSKKNKRKWFQLQKLKMKSNGPKNIYI